jgi:hypothetical protein
LETPPFAHDGPWSAHAPHFDEVTAMSARSAVATFIAVLLAPAALGVAPAAAADCAAPPDASPVFARWLDPADYFLAPDGGLEAGGSGWALGDGASVAAANEPWAVSGPGRSALDLPAGAQAASPTVCVGLDRPTVRFFARRTDGGPLATLRVDALVAGGPAVPVGTIVAGEAWAPGPPLVVAPSLLPLLTGSRTPVQFRFRAQGGAFQVDDLYVDPYGSR